jgi:hypothetical protein
LVSANATKAKLIKRPKLSNGLTKYALVKFFLKIPNGNPEEEDEAPSLKKKNMYFTHSRSVRVRSDNGTVSISILKREILRQITYKFFNCCYISKKMFLNDEFFRDVFSLWVQNYPLG